MDSKDLLKLTDALKEYLATAKDYIPNIERLVSVSDAMSIAREMYPEHKITLAKDPLQMGVLFLEIIGTDITVIGEREMELFQQMVDKADNFEIIPINKDEVRLSICFADAFQVILK